MSDIQADERYALMYEMAFKALHSQLPELSEAFNNEIQSEGYHTAFDLSPRERLFRLLLFFEYTLVKLPNLLNVNDKLSQINEKIKGEKILEVKFNYSNNKNRELSATLSEANQLFNQLNYRALSHKFRSLLDSYGLTDIYERYKIETGVRKFELK